MYSLSYPTAADLELVAPDLMAKFEDNDPIFDILPRKARDSHVLMVEKRDNMLGLQQVRGLNAPPKLVQTPGLKQFTITPGVYGEVRAIDEQELTLRRQYGNLTRPIDVSDLVDEAFQFLLLREVQRQAYEGWTLLAYGIYNAVDQNGVVMDSYQYQQNTFTSTVPWTTFATATPLLDFRSVQLMSAGYSVSFGPGSKAYMNQITANALLGNTNAADIYGRRTAGLGTFNSPVQVNQLLMGDNLPEMVIWDNSYRDDAGAVQRYIPSGYVIVAGRRPAGQVLGNFQITRNANNADQGPRPYTFVKDTLNERVPRTIEVNRGWNGGPVVYYGSAIIVMKVF